MKRFKIVFILLSIIFITKINSYSQTVENSQIVGLLLSSNNIEPISEANVFLLKNNQIIFKTKSNLQGWFKISNVENGTYKIKIISKGYKKMISKNFNVEKGKTNNNYKIILKNSEIENTFNYDELQEYELNEEREFIGIDDK